MDHDTRIAGLPSAPRAGLMLDPALFDTWHILFCIQWQDHDEHWQDYSNPQEYSTLANAIFHLGRGLARGDTLIEDRPHRVMRREILERVEYAPPMQAEKPSPEE